MKTLLTDPVILICSGIILVAVIAFFWTIGKFRQLKSAAPEEGPVDDLGAGTPELPDIDFRAPAIPAAAVTPKFATPPVSREVSDRLETMSQRLAEMQTVLMKQSAGGAATPGAGAAGVGQGFSPETIDKLLKIIGNVIQQVDILQKNLNFTKE